MSNVKYEDLEIYDIAYSLALKIHDLVSDLPKSDKPTIFRYIQNFMAHEDFFEARLIEFTCWRDGKEITLKKYKKFEVKKECVFKNNWFTAKLFRILKP